MSKRAAATKIPAMAIPVSLFGLEACALADEIGCDVATVAVNKDGFRPMSTADARDFIAKQPGSKAWASVIWLTVAYQIGF